MICHEQVKQIEMVRNKKKPFLDEYSLTQRKRIYCNYIDSTMLGDLTKF
jgi:hypothetical protein